jgi:hypothetical protein
MEDICSTEEKTRVKKFLQRRGWMDTSILNRGGEEVEPSSEELDRVLDIFYLRHRGESFPVPTAVGSRLIAEEKVFYLFYTLLGWEQDGREFYDLITSSPGGYEMKEEKKFFRDVGLNFSPDEKTFQKMLTVHRLCARYSSMFIDGVPADDREYFEWYLRVISGRLPSVEENPYRYSPISSSFSFSVMKDLFRLAFLTSHDSYVDEEWRKQKELPPESYHDELFLEFYKKLNRHEMVVTILNDLWGRAQNWAFYRLIDRLRKGYVMGRKGLRRIPLIEARLLSQGERIMGEWNREELAALMEMAEGEFPHTLFDMEE